MMSEINESFQGYAAEYFNSVKSTIDKIDMNQFANAFELILKTIAESGTIYFIGNGGSAGTCNHLVNDLLIGVKKRIGLSIKAVSLCANAPVITCISNDIGYDAIFSQQLEPVAKNGDLIIAISASGNSPNIVKAVEFAKDKDIPVIGITGFDGGYLKKAASETIHFPTALGDYEVAEDMHLMSGHIISTFICKYLERNADKGFRSIRGTNREVTFN
jgi:D-sedoheptulose 7-phosphate isomerase